MADFHFQRSVDHHDPQDMPREKTGGQSWEGKPNGWGEEGLGG